MFRCKVLCKSPALIPKAESDLYVIYHVIYKLIKAMGLALFALLLCLTACTPKTDETDKAPLTFDPLIHEWPQDLSDIPPDPNVTYGRLENGLRYALRTNARPEKEAMLLFWVRAGSRNEMPETIGLAHYLEHMAFNGSENIPEGEMVKSLERLGLSFGADTNASTTYWRTQYQLKLPNVDKETLDYGFFVMRETADKLLLDPEAVERERGVVKAEEAIGNTPGRKASRAYFKWAYPERRSTTFNVIGSPESLDAISADQLKSFYRQHYRPERSLIVMVGDLPVEKMRARIEETFSDWKVENTPPDEPNEGENIYPETKAKTYLDPALTTQIYLSDLLAPSAGFDTLAARREHHIRSYANAIVNQRLRKKILSENAPVLGASISYSSGKINDISSATLSVKKNDWQSAITFIENEIRQALTYGLQQAEYDELIASTRRSLKDAVNYAPKRHTHSLANRIMSGFASGLVITTPKNTQARFEDILKDVSLAELNASFKDMWEGFDPIIWLQGPEIEGVTDSDILAQYTKAKAEPVSPPETRENLTFAYDNFGPKGKIVWEGRVEDFDIDQVKFANNVRLNMKQTDFEKGWVRINVTVGEGWNVFPKDQPGLTNLAGSLPLGGFTKHKASELSQIFAGKNIALSLSIGKERLSFSGATNQDDLRDQFKVWTALLTAPGYQPVWQQKFRDSIEASFHTLDSTPGGVASRDLGRIWANGDERYGMMPKQTYLSYTLEDVRDVLAPIFETGAIEIGVVGDFDKDKIIDIVSETFGALPTRRDKFRERAEAFKITFPQPARVALTHQGAQNQGAKYLAWPTHQPWTLERSRHYTMIRQIFQNRLIDEIRENQGLSYSPSAGMSFSRLSSPYGYGSVSISADPKFFDAFEKTAIKLTENLRSGDITHDELDRARKPILESFERNKKENRSWQSVVLRSQTDPRAMIYRRSRTKAYEDMNPASLNKYVKELYDPKTLHIVSITPEEHKDTDRKTER